ncbi:hypothetical protein ACFVAJ_18405 [Agromyces sp. NPDC057679]|uniref:hypothetical protein n=1 Tax=Agromyces sp. NPDC057679 TaxID=3346207 RepID=UPI0036714C5C
MIKLTARQRDILRILRFRAACETGDRTVCWLGDGKRRDLQLMIVPTMYGGWESFDWLRDTTIGALEQARLVTLGDHGEIPEPYRRGGVTHGRTVRITEAGLAAIERKKALAR